MSNLAVHAIAWNNGEIDKSSYLFVVSALDGSYISRLIKITHNSDGEGEAIVKSSGLLYDNYNRVYTAFNLVAEN